MKFATFRHVALLRAGTWDASTGRVTVTLDHLASIVAYAQDPESDLAVIKLGHVDPERNDIVERAGDPVYGQVINLSQEGDTVYGDLINVPEPLAKILASAYPARSSELLIAANATSFAAITQRGSYSAIFTGIALLGVKRPAVKGLGVIGDAVYACLDAGDRVHVTVAPGHVAVFCTGLTPMVPIVTEAVSHTGPATDAQGGHVDIKELAKRLGLSLADTATDGDAEAAIVAKFGAAPPTAAPASTVPPAAVTTPPAAPAAVPGMFAVPAGFVVVEASQLNSLQETAKATAEKLDAVVKETAKEKDDALLAAALTDGRLTPGSKTLEIVTAQLAAGGAAREGAHAFVGSLVPVIKTGERGATEPGPTQLTDDEMEAARRASNAVLGIRTPDTIKGA